MRSQMPDETLTNYITELRIISKKCSFETITPDQILRDRIISGLTDNELRKKLLAKTDLTLENVIQLCKTVETVLKQAEVFNKEHINTIYKNRDVNKKKEYNTKHEKKNNSRYENKNDEKT